MTGTRHRGGWARAAACLAALVSLAACKRKSNSFQTGVALNIVGIVGNPLPVDVVSGGQYSPTFAQVAANLQTTAGDLSLVSSDSTTIDSAEFYLDVDADSAGLLCAAPPCSNLLHSQVPVYNGFVSYSGVSPLYVQVFSGGLKAGYLYRLAGSNDYIHGTLRLRLRGHNGRGETVESVSYGSAPFLIRDFPG